MRIVRAAALLCGFMAATACVASEISPRVITHENRTAAGALKHGVLRLRLEIREGEWYPEAEDGPHTPVYAFAEWGKPPMIPGPLIRVPLGTKIEVSVRNSTAVQMVVHGFHRRPGGDEPVWLNAGDEHEFGFAAGTPGTYYYWAAPPGRSIAAKNERHGPESQLSGALIVDESGNIPADRIFVIGLWRHFPNGSKVHDVEFGTINGKSWPHSERLKLKVGSRVRWRWINASSAMHPMHLHGSFYQLDAVGDGEREEVFAAGKRPAVVTQNMDVGETMRMSWTPARPGRWLFHCHIIAHFEPKASLSAIAKIGHEHSVVGGGMVGLVLGIDVEGREKLSKVDFKNARRLKLLVTEPQAGQVIELKLVDGKTTTGSPALIGPPIILHKDEPTEIEVVNELRGNTAIHWHGMELESYYDGVPDYGGTGGQVTPPIGPGKNFVARMTPPRAGTFIYHTHWHDVDQLREGLYGPLIVLPAGEEYRPEQDVAFIAGLTVKDINGPLLINGTEHGEALVRGGKVRVRLINMTPNNTALLFTLSSAGQKLRWRPIAKDGMDLPAGLKLESESVQRVGVGETYDFEVVTRSGDEMRLEAYLPGPKLGSSFSIHVR